MMQEQLDAGLTQPAIVVDLTLDQLAAQSKPAAARVAAARRVSTLPERDPVQRTAAPARAGRTPPTPAVRAGWTTLETFLRDTYRPQARPQTGADVVARRTGRRYAR